MHVRARAVRYLRLSTSTGALQGSDTAAPAPSDAGKTALYTALAIDSQDSAHVAYAYGTVGADRTAPQAETLFYATNRTGSFTQVAPSQVSAEHGAWNAIAVDDQSGAVYIGHSRFLRSAQGQAQLHVTWKASATGSWSDDTIAPLGSYKALVLGAAGTPHMIFRQFNQSPDRVMYATKSAGGWQLTQLDSGAGAGRWVQLTRAAPGELHAMYEIDGQSRVMHLQQNACP